MKGKVLVTGASGFAGSHLAKLLVSKGYDVRVLVRKTSSLDYIRDFLDKVEVVHGDITSESDLADAIEGCDIVCHVAGALGHGVSRELLWATNSMAVGLVAKVCLSKNVKHLVHCSTAYVLGLPSARFALEDSVAKPETEYELSKADGEKKVLEYANKGLNVTVLRPPPIVGPGDTKNLLKLFKMASKGVFPLVGSGDNLFQVVYVENLSHAFEFVLGNEQAYGRVFHVADEATSLKCFVEMLSNALGKKVYFICFPVFLMACVAEISELISRFGFSLPMTKSRLRMMTKDYSYSTEALKGLSWSSKKGLQEGLVETVKWYQNKGLI
ncbi:MAG: NAD-dependent epimerase/dehydratase family protein [Candidatus Altiarchaeota archaeon]|nr:NAD-dependent epimerase/dehydratase family protein [Candidatus Altiarchaeota archaeon]